MLVVGPSDSGKSTLCRILCSYSARLERNITYVDVDVGQGNITVPGSIAASPIDKTSLDVEVHDGRGSRAVECLLRLK